MEFKHLLPEERQIWATFLERTPMKFLELRYDVHLGKGLTPPPDAPEWLKAQIAATSRKRCDVVGETEDAIWIFEVTPRAGMAAFGKVLNYMRLYREEYAPSKPLRGAVVCWRVEPDVAEIYREHNIEIFVV
jgi:hypothetical protein